jgi:predicted metal-binding membrane protein
MSPGLTALRLAWRDGGVRGAVSVAAGAWLLLYLWRPSAGPGPCPGGHHGAATAAHHGAATAGFHCTSVLLSDWMLMVAAMMAPLLVPMVNHVWRSSLPRRRFDSLLALAAGYGLCWAAVGILLMPVSATIGQSWFAAAALGATGLAWSSSPIAQYARNRCHRLRGIDPFGIAADRDSFLQGVMAGGPCVLACWPWMLLPMSAPKFHLALALAVTAVLFLERLAKSKRPAWRAPPVLETLALLAPRPRAALPLGWLA